MRIFNEESQGLTPVRGRILGKIILICEGGIQMLWEEVKKAYPDKWVVFEAIEAHSENNFRIVDEIAVIDSFDNSMDAFRRHSELHKQKPNRELYFFHTSRKSLDIREKKWAGLRKI